MIESKFISSGGIDVFALGDPIPATSANLYTQACGLFGKIETDQALSKANSKRGLNRLTALASMIGFARGRANTRPAIAVSVSDGESVAETIDAIVKAGIPHAEAVEIVAGASGASLPKTTPSSEKTDFASLVAGQMRKGKTKAQAISHCAQNFPDAYADWRRGDTSKLDV